MEGRHLVVLTSLTLLLLLPGGTLSQSSATDDLSLSTEISPSTVPVTAAASTAVMPSLSSSELPGSGSGDNMIMGPFNETSSVDIEMSINVTSSLTQASTDFSPSVTSTGAITTSTSTTPPPTTTPTRPPTTTPTPSPTTTPTPSPTTTPTPSPTTTPAPPPSTSQSTPDATTDSSSPSAPTSDATSDGSLVATSGPSSSPVLGVVLGVLIGVIVVIVLLLVLVLLYFFCSRYKGGYIVSKKNYYELEERGNGRIISTDQLFAHLSDEELVTVSLEKLQQHVDELAEDDGYKAEEEYNAAREMDPEPNTNHASLSCNEGKNRYINILARDDTRVVLRGGKGADYINGNYVKGFNHEREYIACQGPLPDTVIDFWRMIWEQNTSVIVMVTNPTENGIVKCETYWPPLSMQYGHNQVKVESEMLYPEFIIRQFTVIHVSSKNRKEEGRRSVTQFHFTSWPDFGVPQDSSSMLKFVRCIRSHMNQNSTSGPVVVHCSAGVGRTGTFIAIDIMTQQIAEAKRKGELEQLKLSVQEVVCKMRAQRGNMVQTSAQYLFIYNSLLRVITHGRTDIKEENLKEHVAKLTTPISSDSDKTWLDKEFSHVMNVKLPPDSMSTVAYEDYNESKNRNMDNIPFDHNRVMLEGKEDDEEDYVNASYIDGYYNRVEFICTDHPLQSTRIQFWTMLVERSIDIMVVFGQIKDPEDRYWPEEKEILKLGDDLTIVGEEVDEEDEEEEEKGREADTEEEEEDGKKEDGKKEDGKKEDGKSESQASGSQEAEGASNQGKEEKSKEEKSEDEIVKSKEGPESKKEGEAAGGVEKEKAAEKESEKTKEESKKEGEAAGGVEKEKAAEKESEKTKEEEPQKVEDKKEDVKAKDKKDEEEVKSKPNEEEKKQEGEQAAKAEEKQTVEGEKKKEEEQAVVVEKAKEEKSAQGEGATEKKTAGAQDVAPDEGARDLDNKDKQSGAEGEQKSETKEVSEASNKTEKTEKKKEDEIQLVESETGEAGKGAGAAGEGAGAAVGVAAAKQVETDTNEGNSKRTKKSVGEKEIFVVVRNFTVTLDETSQPVKMYHVVGWPSEGTPQSTSPMLQLVHRSRDHWKNTGFNSILLHTATGVKDEVSGVYCGLCVLLRMLQIEQEVDLVTTMERLRQQRPGILRNKDFYLFVYKVLERVVNSK